MQCTGEPSLIPVRKQRPTLLAVIFGIIVTICMTSLVYQRQGNLAWDDADYLRCGLRVANRTTASTFPPVTAIRELLKESPKPPLLVGWLTAVTLMLGRTSLELLIIAGSVVPFCILLGSVVLISRYHFGPHASLIASLATLASGLVLSHGAKVMVETLLSLTILASLHFAALVLRRPTPWRGFLLGISVGFAMLAKLTVALLLSGPAVVFVVLLFRRYGNCRATRIAVATALAGNLLLAGPWYFQNGRAAVQFARFSSRYQIEAEGRTDRVDSLSRIKAYGSQVAGWPTVAVLGLFAAGLALGLLNGSSASSPTPDMRGGFVLLASAGLLTGAAVLLLPAYFDPRFLSPIWPSFAVAMGGLITLYGSQRFYMTTCSVLLIGSVLSFANLYREPETKIYWAARDLIDDLTVRHGLKLIGNVGNTRDWNVSKTGMLNETRDNPEDCFVLHDLSHFSPERLEKRLKNLDAVLVLTDPEILREVERNAPGLNETRGLIDRTIQNSELYRRIPTPQIVGLPDLNVYIRTR